MRFSTRPPLVASSAVGGMFFILPSGMVGKLSASGKPGSRVNRPRIARPRRAVDADVGLAVGVPIAGDGQVVLRAELGPQVALVPAGRCR